MPETINPPEPIQYAKLDRIALAFSGGGFRAASYTLGALSFLHHVKLPDGKTLLDKVVFIASASGGTITNAYYSISRINNKPFLQFYKELKAAMEGQTMMQATLEILNDDTQWPEGHAKNRNLVNAFSKMIDRQLFNGATFGSIEASLGGEFSVCFNVNELHRGRTFRFQVDNSSKSKELIGNGVIYINREKEGYKKLRLSDITTSSSAFPAGFEPMMYPNDFTYQDTGNKAGLSLNELKNSVWLKAYNKKRKLFNGQFGLMDGGIRDNQALYSTMEADKRTEGGYDVIMVSDVASYFIDPYESPVVADKPKKKWLDSTLNAEFSRIKTIHKRAGRVLGLALIASIILLAGGMLLNIFSANPKLVDLGLIGFGMGLVGVVASCVLIWLKKTTVDQYLSKDTAVEMITEMLNRFKFAKNFAPEIIDLIVSYLSKLKIKYFIQMLEARAKSVLMIALDINLKNSRDLIYELFFKSKRYTDKRVYNVVYELSRHNQENRQYRVEKTLPWIAPQDQRVLLDNLQYIQETAESARTMGTTLWFDNENKERLDDLIACGQFTTCSNLLEHLMMLESKGLINPADKALFQSVRAQLEEHWNAFKTNPERLV